MTQTITERTASGTERRLAADEFRDVIGRFASGVTIITTVRDGERLGTTASAVSSLSLEPPMLLVCLNKASTTGDAIAVSRSFAVNILAENQDELASRFARKGADKFRDVRVLVGPSGLPLLADALAHLECRVTEEATGGTHSVFLAEVETATGREGPPLAYFRGQFGYLEPVLDESAHAKLADWMRDRRELWGQPIDVAEVAGELGLTPGSTYHALARLAAEGIVQTTPEGRYVVTPITLDVVEEFFDARHAILMGVIDMTIGKVMRADVARLREMADLVLPAIDNYSSSASITAYTEADDAFHEAMIELTGSTPLLQAYRRLTAYRKVRFAEHLFTETQEGVRSGEVIAAFAADHEDLVRAYETDDLELAREALRRHIGHAKQILRGSKQQ